VSPEVGVVAPAVYCSNGERLQPASYGKFPTVKSILLGRNIYYHETLTPEWVSGVAMLVRRSDFEAVRGFDPDLVMYLEDVDLCRRLRALGKEVRRELTAGVDHLVGQSWTNANDQCRYAQASRVIYSQKAGFSLFGRLAIRTLQTAHLHWHRLAPRTSTGVPARLFPR
ncbi:MAG: hypothetical protein M3083_08135, partial [Actinomycetota bacterium]|nr:hypothetical protein [Actinomycetota bacterium]